MPPPLPSMLASCQRGCCLHCQCAIVGDAATVVVGRVAREGAVLHRQCAIVGDAAAIVTSDSSADDAEMAEGDGAAGRDVEYTHGVIAADGDGVILAVNSQIFGDDKLTAQVDAEMLLKRIASPRARRAQSLAQTAGLASRRFARLGWGTFHIKASSPTATI